MQRWLLVLLAAAACLAAAAWLAPSAPLAPRLAYGVAFVVVAAQLLACAAAAPALGLTRVLPLVAGCAAGLIALRGQPPTVAPAVALTLLLSAGASSLGAAIGARIEQPGHLLAVAGISALMDLWSVLDSAGVSARMAERAAERPAELALFALPWPMLGTPHVAPIIGAGDLVFAALYLAALRRHGLSVRRAAWALAAAFAAGLAVLLLWERPIPLLPLLGAAVVAAEPAVRRLRGRDLAAFVVALLGVGGVLVYRMLRP